MAIQGATHDGHAFLAAARKAGAAVVIVNAGSDTASGEPTVVLPDTAAAAPHLAANAFGRPGDHLLLAAVTGTNGKTTTAHLVAAMLESAGIPHLRLGTTGNWIVDHEVEAAFTTPLPIDLQASLASAVQAGASHGIMEVSSHALMQHRVEPLLFRAAGMTSFSQDHLDFHGSMAAYLEAKLRLAGEHLTSDAIAVAAVDAGPGMQHFLDRARGQGARAWSASRHRGHDIWAHSIEFAPHRTRACIETPAGALELSSPLIGDYNLDNIMVAIGLALGLGLPLDPIALALQEARGAPGRLERVEVPGCHGPRVVVDYAHTPDAVERALEAVRRITQGRLFVVLGCGGDRDASKRGPMAHIAALRADRFWLTADNPRTEAPEAIAADMWSGIPESLATKVEVELDRAAAISAAISTAREDDWILIAGKGHETYQIVGRERQPFDDRTQARLALDARMGQAVGGADTSREP